MVYRKLSRHWKHRKALLRNLVSELIEHESITTTHAKAKEAQTQVERLITLAKNKSPNEKQARIRADKYVFKPASSIPKLFGDLAERYAGRQGGYTRVLRLENRIGDNAPQSILELVGGRRDMKMAITARAVARLESENKPLDDITTMNVQRIIANDPAMEKRFREEVATMKQAFYTETRQYPPVVERPQKSRAPVKFVENPLVRS